MFNFIMFVLSYLFSGFYMGGVITGIIFPYDGPIDHKIFMFIAGNAWNAFVIILFIFLL